MAKRLPHDEAAAYHEALAHTEPGPQAEADAFQRALEYRRDTALELCPELRNFFAREFAQLFTQRQ